MTQSSTLRERLNILEGLRLRAIEVHGDMIYDTDFYEELLEQIQNTRDILMQPEPATDKEYETRWH